jgi:hypothetical protein
MIHAGAKPSVDSPHSIGDDKISSQFGTESVVVVRLAPVTDVNERDRICVAASSHLVSRLELRVDQFVLLASV